VTKFCGPDAAGELDTLDAMRAAAAIPCMISADLEGSRMSLPFGTEMPNPLALAAVDDVQGLLPLSPDRHRRVLVYSTGIITPLHGADEPMAFPDLLRAEGFEVTLNSPEARPDPRAFDPVLFLMGEETLLTRGRIFLDWNMLTGGMLGAMQRATLDCLPGRAPFQGKSPVDPFCGLPDAAF
jgi:beta-N-acetylhexosaminidase